MRKNSLIAAILLATIASAGVGVHAQNADDATTKFRPRLMELNQGAKPLAPLSTVMASVQATVAPASVSLNGLPGIILTVHNCTDRPIVVDTEHATASAGNICVKAAQAGLIDTASCPKNVPPAKYKDAAERIAAAAVSIGAVQFVRDTINQRGPVLGRYGCDERRRQNELAWFGKRVIWPDQTMQGVVYFAAPGAPAKALMQVPVSTIYDDEDKSTLLVQL